jgi:REP element-mobilizing transposase RayT
MMPYRRVQFRAGKVYHLYNRGANRQPIFFCEENWTFFIRQRRHYFDPDLLDVLVYCLMPTHYHLAVLLKTDGLSARVMQPFTVSYTKAVNKQQGRTGPLFQGPFQAVLVDRDEYLVHLSRYIHMNPVAAGLVAHPEEWAFSSYRDYVGLRARTLPALGLVLSQFDSREAYREFVEAVQPEDVEIIEDLLLE